jgi:hypothetical protein
MQPALLYSHAHDTAEFCPSQLFRGGPFTARSLLKFHLGMPNQLTTQHDSIIAAEKLNNASFLTDNLNLA